MTTAALTPDLARARRIDAYKQWIAYCSMVAIYGILREGANYTGLPIHARYAIGIDRALGAGRTPTEWLQLGYRGHPGWWDVVAVLVWASFFFVPHIVAWRLFRLGRLPRYTRAGIAMLSASLVLHYLLPTAPPWWAALERDMGPVYRIVEAIVTTVSPAVYSIGNATLGSNPVSAMPSVHTAWTALAALGIASTTPQRLLPVLYVVAMAFSLAYLGEHYLVDCIVGVFLAVGAWQVTGGQGAVQR